MPKGYKIIIDWFQQVSEDPEYANPEMRNETRDMDGNIVDSDDEEDMAPKRGWNPDDYEAWVPADDKKPGVVLEEIKDEEVSAEEEPETQPIETSPSVSTNTSTNTDTKENAARDEGIVSTLPGKVMKLASGLNDMLANVAMATTGVNTTQGSLPIRSNVTKDKETAVVKTEVQTDAKEINEDADDAGKEDVC